jgi:hypothetical protein
LGNRIRFVSGGGSASDAIGRRPMSEAVPAAVSVRAKSLRLIIPSSPS